MKYFNKSRNNRAKSNKVQNQESSFLQCYCGPTCIREGLYTTQSRRCLIPVNKMTGSMYKNTANQPGPRKRYTNQPADMHLILPKVEQISLRKMIQ